MTSKKKLGIVIGIFILILGACVCMCGGLGVVGNVAPAAETTEQPTDVKPELPTVTLPQPSPTPEQTATPRPMLTATTKGPSPADLAYISCAIPVYEGVANLALGSVEVFSLGQEDPLNFCDYWKKGNFTAKALGFGIKQEECPIPDTSCELESRQWIADGLLELMTGFGCIDLWCVDANMFDISLIEQASQYIQRGSAYIEQGNSARDRCDYD
jgi:hypothetical protein